MHKLGFSIYLDAFRNQFEVVEALAIENTLIFTSLHIKEEMDQNYVEDCITMIRYFKSKKALVMADISKITLQMFEVNTIDQLQEKLGLDYIRLDFGFSVEQMIEASRKVSLVLNASTLTDEQLEQLKNIPFMAMHNYYPRIETGLDVEQVEKMNQRLKAYNIPTIIFIEGKYKRKPLYQGLPTIEILRNVNPYVAYAFIMKKQIADYVFLGDVGIDKLDFEHIQYFDQNWITLKTDLPYTKVFKSRFDSPKSIIRLEDTRSNAVIEPFNTTIRTYGSITQDNRLFLRYQGEMQITRCDLPAHPSINKIGEVQQDYLLLLELIEGNDMIRLEGKKNEN